MELTKKTTILFPPDLYQHLVREAKSQHKSVGELVREACEEKYRFISREERIAAAEAMGRLQLPVGTVEEMEAESEEDPWKPLP